MEKRFFWSVFLLAGILGGPVLAAERPTYTCYRLAKAPVIDGDLPDWPGVPVIFLGRQEQVSTGEWKGPKDCYGTVRLGWDDRALYFAIEVTDDEVVQDLPDENAGLIFQQDSVQWAIDISGKGGTGYDGDDYEYGFGKTAGGPCVYRWQVSSSGLVPGRTNQVSLAVKRTATGLIYEAAVPFEQLIPLRPRPGMKIGFTILIQDQDKSGKKTIEWTSGISCGKAPGQFGLLEFSDAAAGAGSDGIFISGETKVDRKPVAYQVITTGAAGAGKLFLLWVLKDSSGAVKAKGTAAGDKNYQFIVDPRKLTPGSYTISCKIAGKGIQKPLTTSLVIERIAIEMADQLREKIKGQMRQLRQMISEARAKKAETTYAEGVLAVAEVFQPFVEEDLKKERKVLALRNLKVLYQELDRQIKTGAEDRQEFNVPRPDMSKIVIKDGEFYAGAKPVILVGTMSWLWDVYSWRDKFGPVGFNTVRIGMEPATLYDDKGKLMKDIPWWAMIECIRAAKSQNLAIGTTTPVANQIWTSLLRAGPVSMERFREEYKSFTRLAMDRIGRGNCFYHEIAVEGWRPPTQEVKNISDRFDRTMKKKELVAEELKRCAAVVRKEDPTAYVGGYPTLLMMDDEGDFFGSDLDPELDLSAYDVCDADTAGNYVSRRFAMDTIHWLAMYRDWMGGLAPGKPQWDGEFHFVNERRSYPAGWVRAIHFQGYIHGMSGSFSWVWNRSDAIDSAILMDAQVAMEYSRTALDLRRLAGPIVAFHRVVPQVAILYSHTSTPYQHLRQMRTVYEGLFFEGTKVTFISDRQVARGRLGKLNVKGLIVPAASHVSDETAAQVAAFAEKGGVVFLVGDSFKFDPRGKLREKKTALERMTQKGSFNTAAEARVGLKPWLEKLGAVPPVKVETTGSSFPVLEWRYAKNGKDNLVYLFNMGHHPATVTIWNAGKKVEGTDLVDGNKFNPNETMKSLDVKIIKF